MATAEGMEPPVAVLLYVPEESKRAAFYPFAEFSPEWQALLFALKNGVSPRFIDLPQSFQFALQKERENEHQLRTFRRTVSALCAVILWDGWGRLRATAAGEEWWEHMVEQRQDGKELFGAIAEAMTAVRSDLHHTPTPSKPDEKRCARRT
jgi:hypothetical protein